ncbi:MAG: uracil-DNA glycosylase [Candidatus Absconditabacteria bacterium]|nr:uracil-DNA glycosylase [Candidatus Absconditabacteria bacterium]MDD4714408.1 uracil-DNA glycosylase [Candidatus Absconditabacteria bacterium]
MTINVQIEESREQALTEEFQKPYFSQIKQFLQQEKAEGKTIFPAGTNIFNAFNTTPFDQVKVVILGQDPYHGTGEAHGLSFSVLEGIRIPPSLKNIYKELHDDLGLAIPTTGNLTPRAKQGVFLLNASLTVRKDNPNSHKDIGRHIFTDAVIKKLSEKKDHLVFILRGAFAQQKTDLIDKSKHMIIRSPHPSPFSADRGFFGSKPFSKTNDYLKQHGISGIDWRI